MRLPGGKRYFKEKRAQFKGGPLRAGDFYGEKGYPQSDRIELDAIVQQVAEQLVQSGLYLGNPDALKSK
jgi:hypothetical protein